MCCFGQQLFSICHPLLNTGKKWVPTSVQQKENKKPGLDNLETSLFRHSWKFHIYQSSKILENVLLWWTQMSFPGPPPLWPSRYVIKHLREGLANGNKTRERECLLFLILLVKWSDMWLKTEWNLVSQTVISSRLFQLSLVTQPFLTAIKNSEGREKRHEMPPQDIWPLKCRFIS